MCVLDVLITDYMFLYTINSNIINNNNNISNNINNDSNNICTLVQYH